MCRTGRRGGLKIPCANNTCGFDPHHRHKKGNSPSLSGGVSFLSAAYERVEQHGPDKECSGNVNRPHLPDRMVYRSGNGAVHFCAAASAFYLLPPCACRQFRSALFSPCKRVLLPAAFVAAVPPGFSGNSCLFCRKGVLWPGRSAEMRFRPFILPFLTAFTMFFIKKTLQMNFKNLLYNYKFNFFTQTFSYRFVWGSWVCAFRTASALR